MPNKYSQPVMDIYPWPDGLGFNGADAWWIYVRRQSEEEKLNLLITMAHFSDKFSQQLLVHDLELFDRFQLRPQTVTRLCAIQSDCLSTFVRLLVEQNNIIIKGGI
jgi:hypothetical protein